MDAVSPDIDLAHLILFEWVGVLAAGLGRRASWWRVALPLTGLAVATELLQFLVDGRHPRVGDVFVDLLGVAGGTALASALRWLWPSAPVPLPALHDTEAAAVHRDPLDSRCHRLPARSGQGFF